MLTDREGIEVAKACALLSPDPSRKIGCVIEEKNGSQTAGWNDFPLGVKHRLELPAKYTYIEHAERNAIYRAARWGGSLDGSTIYLSWYPCAECARAIVCSGIKRLVGYKPDWTEERYGFNNAKVILQEGGVEVVFLERE
jgi:dCMP deaminase